MSRHPSTLSVALVQYIEAARAAFQPLLDGQPWTEIAVNPAPRFREVVDRLEGRRPFLNVVRAFHAAAFQAGMVSKPLPDDSNDGGSYEWKVGSFLWNRRFYDDIIIGRPPDSQILATALIQEAGRSDVIHKDLGYLENVRCEAGVTIEGAFSIRGLTAEEVEQFFCGGSQLDRLETAEAIHRAVSKEWFVVVERSIEPLTSWLVIPGAIGHHDFHASPLPDINLALNLFKSAAGPAVIRQTFHVDTSAFCRNRLARPSYSSDLHASHWGGSPEQPQLFHYELTAADTVKLQEFWRRLNERFLTRSQYFPLYLHRAISAFLHACAWNREEREFRQLRYVMALESMYAGDDPERPRYYDRQGQRRISGIKESLARCCGALIGSDANSVSVLSQWLRDLYRQRSDIAHANTFEQEIFAEQPQDPDEHLEAQQLAKVLGIDSRCIWDGPDVEFAVLHNIVRESILMFIEHADGVLRDPVAIAMIEELERNEGGFRPPEPIRLRRNHLRYRLQEMLSAARRALLQRLNDTFGIERDRLAIRESLRRYFQGTGRTC